MLTTRRLRQSSSTVSLNDAVRISPRQRTYRRVQCVLKSPVIYRSFADHLRIIYRSTTGNVPVTCRLVLRCLGHRRINSFGRWRLERLPVCLDGALGSGTIHSSGYFHAVGRIRIEILRGCKTPDRLAKIWIWIPAMLTSHQWQRYQEDYRKYTFGPHQANSHCY